MERITNSFEGGWNRDLDKELRGSNTYTRSVNGRLVFNEDGTMSWENARGTMSTISGFSGRFIVGASEIEDVVVILSTNGTDGEIGVLVYQPNGTSDYSVLYNDATDANSFDFQKDFLLEVVSFYENKDMYRVYWVDDYNEPRTFTFKKNTILSIYEPVTTSVAMSVINPNWQMGNFWFVQQIEGGLLTGMYQYTYRMISADGYTTPWYPIGTPVVVTSSTMPSSVNDYHLYDFDNADEISTKGNVFKLTRYDKTFDKIEVAYVHSIASAGAKESTIFHSGEVDKVANEMYFHHTSNSGLPIADIAELIDRRESIIKAKTIQIKDNRLWMGNTEVNPAFDIPDDVLANVTVKPKMRAYLEDNTAYGLAGGGSGNPAYATTKREDAVYVKSQYDTNNSFTVELETERENINSGNPVQDLPTYKGSHMTHDRVGYFRNETYRFGILFFDKKGNPMFVKHLADVDIPPQNDTDNSLRSKMRVRRIRSDGSIHYPTPFEESPDFYTMLTGGAKHGENPGLDLTGGVLSLTNRKDTELVYRYHWDPSTASITGTTYHNKNNLSFIRIVGLEFGGIELATPVPELDNRPLHEFVGGFSIVRVPREGDNEQVVTQGLVHNCHYPEFDTTTFQPHHGIGGYYMDVANGANQYYLYGHDTRDVNGDVQRMRALGHIYSYDCPDYMFRAHPTGVTINGKLKFTSSIQHGWEVLAPAPQAGGYAGIFNLGALANHAWVMKGSDSMNSRFYGNTSIPGSKVPAALGYNNVYTKYNTDLSITTHEAFSMSTTISSFSTTGRDLDLNRKLELAFKDQAAGGDGLGGNGTTSSVDDYDGSNDKKFLRSWHHRNGLLVHLQKPYNTYIGFGADFTDHFGYNIFTYYERNLGQYGGLTLEALEGNIFHTTNHFQPVTDYELSNIANGNQRTFNNVEVWGGDCYAQNFGFMRLYPRVVNQTNEDNDCSIPDQGELPSDEFFNGNHPDYSLGVTFPLESKFNYALRKSASSVYPIWAQVGARPGAEFTGLTAGIFHYDGYTDTCTGNFETFNLNDALGYRDKVMPYVTKPVNYISNYDYPTRWHWSNEKKPYGEYIDRFREFEELSNFDLNGQYGEVNGNAVLFDYIYSFQEKAFGRLRIKDRAIISSQTTGDIILGEAGIMEGIDYISKTYGTQHRDSIAYTDNNIYWADARNRKLIAFGQNGVDVISDTKGLHSFISPFLEQIQDLETIAVSPGSGGGITTGIDYQNNDVLFTIRVSPSTVSDTEWKISGNVIGGSIENVYMDESDPNNPYGNEFYPPWSGILPPTTSSVTVSYNEFIGVFVGEHTFYPILYFNKGKHFYSVQPIHVNKTIAWQHNIGKRGHFYGSYYYSALLFTVNKFPSMVKKFDTNLLNINKDGVDVLKLAKYITEEQSHSVDVLTESVNVQGGYAANRRAKFRNGLYRFPTRARNERKRITGKYMETGYHIINDTDDKKFSLTSVDTLTRFHKRV